MALTHFGLPRTLGASLRPRDHALALLRLALKPFRRALLRQELEALPDRLLADIGLERADLPDFIRRSRQLDRLPKPAADGSGLRDR